MSTLADGKIIEAWEEYDESGMRRQLAAPRAAPAEQPGS
jgi:hypothetical protein